MEKIVYAAKVANAHNFISALPLGYGIASFSIACNIAKIQKLEKKEYYFLVGKSSA